VDGNPLIPLHWSWVMKRSRKQPPRGRNRQCQVHPSWSFGNLPCRSRVSFNHYLYPHPSLQHPAILSEVYPSLKPSRQQRVNVDAIVMLS
jgi:hypothetical protein